ncbi:hypothetical protein F4780DRAFT_785608 [Xylariomycetidae sp. FL0641]|nr:hypothetical protein F4780DRAFT_785608 [Xylariomycetidae sp. FL0641]
MASIQFGPESLFGTTTSPRDGNNEVNLSSPSSYFAPRHLSTYHWSVLEPGDNIKALNMAIYVLFGTYLKPFSTTIPTVIEIRNIVQHYMSTAMEELRAAALDGPVGSQRYKLYRHNYEVQIPKSATEYLDQIDVDSVSWRLWALADLGILWNSCARWMLTGEAWNLLCDKPMGTSFNQEIFDDIVWRAFVPYISTLDRSVSPDDVWKIVQAHQSAALTRIRKYAPLLDRPNKYWDLTTLMEDDGTILAATLHRLRTDGVFNLDLEYHGRGRVARKSANSHLQYERDHKTWGQIIDQERESLQTAAQYLKDHRLKYVHQLQFVYRACLPLCQSQFGQANTENSGKVDNANLKTISFQCFEKLPLTLQDCFSPAGLYGALFELWKADTFQVAELRQEQWESDSNKLQEEKHKSMRQKLDHIRTEASRTIALSLALVLGSCRNDTSEIVMRSAKHKRMVFQVAQDSLMPYLGKESLFRDDKERVIEICHMELSKAPSWLAQEASYAVRSLVDSGALEDPSKFSRVLLVPIEDAVDIFNTRSPFESQGELQPWKSKILHGLYRMYPEKKLIGLTWKQQKVVADCILHVVNESTYLWFQKWCSGLDWTSIINHTDDKPPLQPIVVPLTAFAQMPDGTSFSTAYGKCKATNNTTDATIDLGASIRSAIEFCTLIKDQGRAELLRVAGDKIQAATTALEAKKRELEDRSGGKLVVLKKGEGLTANKHQVKILDENLEEFEEFRKKISNDLMEAAQALMADARNRAASIYM